MTIIIFRFFFSGEKPHKCEICGKGFRVAYDLRRHVLVHSKNSDRSKGKFKLKADKVVVKSEDKKETNKKETKRKIVRKLTMSTSKTIVKYTELRKSRRKSEEVITEEEEYANSSSEEKVANPTELLKMKYIPLINQPETEASNLKLNSVASEKNNKSGPRINRVLLQRVFRENNSDIPHQGKSEFDNKIEKDLNHEHYECKDVKVTVENGLIEGLSELYNIPA